MKAAMRLVDVALPLLKPGRSLRVALLPGGKESVEVDGNVVTVTVNWLPPGAANERAHTVAATIAAN